MENLLDKWHFERMEKEPEVVCVCEWCSCDIYEETKTAHFIDSGDTMEICDQCFGDLKAQGIIEGSANWLK